MKRWIYSDYKIIDLWNKELIFTAGKIARDENGPLAPWNIEKQSIFIFEEIKDMLEKLGSWLDDIVKATIFLVNIDDFSKVSKIRDKYFKNSKPVSTLVEISWTSRKWCDIEIEITAVKNK